MKLLYVEDSIEILFTSIIFLGTCEGGFVPIIAASAIEAISLSGILDINGFGLLIIFVEVYMIRKILKIKKKEKNL